MLRFPKETLHGNQNGAEFVQVFESEISYEKLMVYLDCTPVRQNLIRTNAKSTVRGVDTAYAAWLVWLTSFWKDYSCRALATPTHSVVFQKEYERFVSDKEEKEPVDLSVCYCWYLLVG